MLERKNSASTCADVGLQAEVWHTAGTLRRSSMDAAEYVPGGDTQNEISAPTFLDLFCGCGGFTLGLLRSGLDFPVIQRTVRLAFNPGEIHQLTGAAPESS